MPHLVVLGGGWSGLVTTLRAVEAGWEVVCVDERFDGGLLSSVEVGGHVFDVGGSHVIFSRNPEVLVHMLKLVEDRVSRERRAFVRLGGRLVPYPFENGIYVLPPEERARYGLSLIKALVENLANERRPRTLGEWIYQFFGPEIARDYLEPYNLKLWKRTLDEVSADWVYTPGRLPVPQLEDVVRAVAGLPTVGYREQAAFYYPRRGGIRRQWLGAYRAAQRAGVAFVRERVREVRKTSDGFMVNGWLRADRMVYTLPLREVPHYFDAPKEVEEAARRLDYNSVVTVGFGLSRPAPDQHWVYVPDPSVVFHRYAWISNYSEDAPSGRSTAIAEITVPPGARVDIEELKLRAFEGFEELDVFEERDVRVSAAWLHEYGYPVYTLGHAEARATVEGWLRSIGVTSFGRWGNWHYWNTDKIYEQARALPPLAEL